MSGGYGFLYLLYCNTRFDMFESEKLTNIIPVTIELSPMIVFLIRDARDSIQQ